MTNTQSPTTNPWAVMVLPLFILGVLGISAAQAQTPVEITADPHYQLLLQNDQVRVFEVSLRQSEQAFVRYEHNFLVVTLTNSDVAMWPEGRSDIQSYRFSTGDVRFFFGGRGVGLRNNQSSEYRNITVEFLDPAVTSFGYQADRGEWNYGDSVLRAPVDPRARFSNSMQLGAATASDVQLLQGDSLPKPDKPTAELVIPITDLNLKAASDIHTRKSPGEVLWLDPGRDADLRNVDPDPAHFVLVELPVKPQH
jgi:hypothetical protein